MQVAEARAFLGLPADQPAESIGMWYPALIRDNPGSVRAVVTDSSFVDIGTPAGYLASSLTLAGAAAAESVAPGSPLVGSRTTVAPSARLVRSVVWEDVEVGDDAWLTECVVTDGVRVPAGVRWQRKAVVPASRCAACPGDEIAGELLLAPID